MIFFSMYVIRHYIYEVEIMKTYQEEPSFPILRRSFSSYKALGDVINRSRSYVNNCMNGRRSFTALEKRMIVAFLGRDNDPEAFIKLFGG